MTSSGSVSGAPVVNPSATPVPFGFTFDRVGHLVVTEAATSALTTYSIAASGTLTELGSTADGLAALCWVTTNGTYFFGANAGSATVTVSYTHLDVYKRQVSPSVTRRSARSRGSHRRSRRSG